MLSIKYSEKRKAKSVKVALKEEKINYFTGSELVVGVGKKSELTQRKRVLIARQVITLAKQYRIKSLNINPDDFGLTGEQLAVNFEMANYEYNDHKTAPPEGWSYVEEINLSAATAGIERGQIIGGEINKCRSLANMPPGLMTPTVLAKKAKEAAKGTKVNVKILDRNDMKILKMEAILGVAQGSSEEPKFIIMEYRGSDRSTAPVVLVGKGVTFDSGGLNIKPSDHIYEMHMDMSGGAAVIHAIAAAAKLGVKRNIIGLIPAVENMPSGSSYHPGDVLKTMSGQTIEVLNTDAEGRVILADALTYAEQYKPQLVVDVATLTGAAQVALGQQASAIFSKDEKILKQVQELGEQSGDYVWPLPLWDEYEQEIKGTFGDWANIGKKRGSGGAIDGAIFLYQFAKKYPWLHIDMAPRMTANDSEYLAKGAAGAPVRLLIKLLEQL